MLWVYMGLGGLVSDNETILSWKGVQLILSHPVVQGSAPWCSLLWHNPLGVGLQPKVEFSLSFLPLTSQLPASMTMQEQVT